jgi:cell division protein FtsN
MNPEDRIRRVDINQLEKPERNAPDKENSFYIWYKESDSDPNVTQNMNKEYELIYQAAKEAEHKSKLKIFAVSFVVFFSLVLLLLIFSPLIYRQIFMTDGIPQVESSKTETINPEQNVNSNTLNQNTTQTPSVENNSPKQSPNMTSVPDEKYNVIYVKLENGAYTIQESSWDTRDKAAGRISKIESLGISGLKGTISEIKLGENKTWYRVRLGSFTSLEEAQHKTEELKNTLK